MRGGSLSTAVAEAARERAVALVARRRPDDHLLQLVGEMDNHLTSARISLEDWVAIGSAARRLERARERMKAHGLGALLLMYDENVRYVTSTLTPGWNRLKPGLRYALLCGDGPPVLFEQGVGRGHGGAVQAKQASQFARGG